MQHIHIDVEEVDHVGLASLSMDCARSIFDVEVVRTSKFPVCMPTAAVVDSIQLLRNTAVGLNPGKVIAEDQNLQGCNCYLNEDVTMPNCGSPGTSSSQLVNAQDFIDLTIDELMDSLMSFTSNQSSLEVWKRVKLHDQCIYDPVRRIRQVGPLAPPQPYKRRIAA